MPETRRFLPPEPLRVENFARARKYNFSCAQLQKTGSLLTIQRYGTKNSTPKTALRSSLKSVKKAGFKC